MGKKSYSDVSEHMSLPLVGHQARVLSVAWSFDDQLIASGSADKTVRVWRVVDGSCTIILDGHKNHI